jgi:diaminopimelate decarboxylase
VVGRSCEVDLLAQGEPLPPVGPGALLVLCLTGAYHEAGASNFNALLRPATVLVRGDAAYAVRVRETIDDVLSRDRVPPHLTSTTTTAGVQ